MSIARHHAEWLSLLDIVGSFLSMEVLLEVFPQGLSAHDSEHFALLKQVYAEWGNEQSDRRIDQEIHRAWVEWVLGNTLGYPQEYLKTGQDIANHWQIRLEQHQETIAPDWVLVDPHDPNKVNKPELLIQIFEPSQKLDGTYKGINKESKWSASPVTRMVELLRGLKVSLGLITNGEEWMLVYAPQGGTSSTVSWYGNIWVEEKITLRAFRDLLGVERFFGVQEQDTLGSLCDRSKNSQQEVTDQLGLQVRKAVEILIQKLAEIDADHQGRMLAGVSMQELYRAACFVMMRLVFLLCAEERGLLLLGEERYDKNYAVSTLQESLRAIADHSGEEILERRHDAWCRLMALFRAVHGGVYHPNFKLPAYGGNLFDPDAFPFLEGRFEGHDEPIAVDNRTVLHLLESLQILRIKVAGGGFEPRRLSFKAIEVEQIGHVYEGLLDHQAIKSSSTVLGLDGTKNKEPEILLEDLEALAAQGEEVLVKFLKKETGRGEAALKKLLPSSPQPPSPKEGEGGAREFTLLSLNGRGAGGEGLSHYEESRYLTRCGNDLQLWHRIKPFYRLIRKDTRDYPVIISAGAVYVTVGTDRRESGTHYTPKALTEEIVRYTLEPLVYVGVSEGLPQDKWKLRSPQEILNLKICDPTMGSGAFLVQVCRYLAARLLESWEGLEGSKIFTVFGNVSKPDLDEALIPDDDLDRLIVAKRLIAERCVYGVDKNPLAVEMAKLSLWLETLQKDKPFTFVDHALRCGDSLVGVTVEQLRFWDLDVSSHIHQLGIGINEVWIRIREAIAKRMELESFTVNSREDRAKKEALLAVSQARIKDLKDRADLLVMSYLANCKRSQQDDLRRELLLVANGEMDVSVSQRELLPDLEALRPFHWELEFPEVFLSSTSQKTTGKGLKPLVPLMSQGGFDAIVGNPPFMGGTLATSCLGEDYMSFCKDTYKPWHGKADYVGLFIKKSTILVSRNGNIGLLATSSLIAGETADYSLKLILKRYFQIYRAKSPFLWQGTAGVAAIVLYLTNIDNKCKCYLDDSEVDFINHNFKASKLEEPYILMSSLKGCMGVKISSFSNQNLVAYKELEHYKLLKKYLKPAIGGEELYGSFDLYQNKYCVDPETIDKDFISIYQSITNINVLDNLFQYSAPAKEMFNRFYSHKLNFGCGETTRIQLSFLLLPDDVIPTHKTFVFSVDSWYFFSFLQSNLYESWAYRYGLRREMAFGFSSKRCSETFPFPTLTPETEKELEAIGEKYYNQRQQIMQTTQLGLTKTYNRFHDPNDTAADIQQLRELHIQMDYAVAKAYGWVEQLRITNYELGVEGEQFPLAHGFHQTKQGLRFTISETARRDILDRLLALNHQRYAEEVKAGLHDKSKGKRKKEKVVQVNKDQTDFLDKINQS